MQISKHVPSRHRLSVFNTLITIVFMSIGCCVFSHVPQTYFSVDNIRVECKNLFKATL